ncbi:MAG: ABC transporter ATP-binding protein [Desulfurococcales archaeon]|nr:ABC transporter ATP-binding protein [Desulfurococcales archaeon]
MVNLRLENVSKYFGRFKAVDNVTLDIHRGEIFTLLGPSGCGKTTTLRIIAGFEIPEEGHVFFNGRDVTFEKPYKRGVAMVFQNYALWPHMTVFDNVAYGLKIKKLPKHEIRKKVRWALELVGLSGLEKRYPLQLSGGQQQRVALARAIVVEPSVLLLDEPLSNLDAKLRLKMREEIVSLQRKLGITTVYVTHDQEEAMSISNRIAVMNKGRVLQVGSPIDVYMKPKDLFVATFIGRSTIIRGVVSSQLSKDLYAVKVGSYKLIGINVSGGELSLGEKVILIARPEDFVILDKDTNSTLAENLLYGIVELVMFIGSFKHLRVKLADGQRITVYASPKSPIGEGDEIRVTISPEDLKIYREKSLEDVM